MEAAPLYQTETRTTEKTFRENGTCKGCKRAFSRLSKRVVRTTNTFGLVSRTRRHVTYEGKADGSGCHVDLSCCGAQVTMKAVIGTRNADVPCDERCTEAKGHKCECACGGRNHGAGHGGEL